MEKNDLKQNNELPDSWWHKVYLAVVVTTVVVIVALGVFTKVFS
jgi:hypothetical protein